MATDRKYVKKWIDGIDKTREWDGDGMGWICYIEH